MAVSRRARSRRAALEAARRQVSGRWRTGGGSGGGGGERVLAMLALSVALVGVGFVLGRWSAGRSFGGGSTAETAPGGEVATVSLADADRAAGGDVSGSAPESEVAHAGAPSDAALGLAAADVVDQPTRPPVELPVAAAGAGPVAIVIDDLGRSLEVIDELRAYGIPLTYAVLPYETKTGAVAARLAELGEEVLCHLPMEPQSGENPGPGALTEAMSADELRDATRKALEAVPGAVGVNNHMGSALSEDREAMTAVVNIVRRRQLFFLDSRTSAASVGYAVAREAGIPAAERKVFLDRDRDPDAIRHELRRLLVLANRGEPAIAIGHPYPETLAVLAELIPKAKEGGFRFVRVSEVLIAGQPAAQ